MDSTNRAATSTLTGTGNGAHPKPQCDLVMKGGITSGIVYPPALVELQKMYSFNSIGGTSAGAIAAAAAAAAEYGSRNSPNSQTQGFPKLTAISETFSPVPSGQKHDPRKLFNLFRAPKATAVVMRVAEAFGSFGGSKPKGLGKVWHNFLVPFKVFGALFRSHWAGAIGLIVGAWLGWAVVGFAVLAAFYSLLAGQAETSNIFFIPVSIFPQLFLAAASILLVGSLTWVFSDTANRIRLRLVLVAMGITAFVAALLLFAVPLLLNWVPQNWTSVSGSVPVKDQSHYSNTAVRFFFTILLAIAGAMAFALYHLVHGVLLKAVPGNFYGIVNGHDEKIDDPKDRENPTRPPMDKATHLSDWLCVSIDEIAGKRDNRPLTFGDLCDQCITLKMISTNLSLGIPYELPFEEEDVFIFNEGDMRRLFPDYVVHHLIQRARSDGLFLELKKRLPPGYHFFPSAREMPVALAARMSLAVPIFISAIPLYTISAQGYQEYEKCKNTDGWRLEPYRSRKTGEKNQPDNDLLLHYFSDGGTTSNFPIHFFDSWLPTRPTFGIELTSMPATAVNPPNGAAQAAHSGDNRRLNLAYLSARIPPKGKKTKVDESVDEAGLREQDLPDITTVKVDADALALTVLPRVNQVALHEWTPVENPFSFLGKVLNTARENHDILQSQLPGYRDRIIQVRLEKDEGGMNLLMSSGTIESVMKKGEEAGKILRCDFNFEHHRWARFRVLMARLEEQLEKMAFAFTHPDYGYPTFIQEHSHAQQTRDIDTIGQEGCPPPSDPGLPVEHPYERTSKWRADALRRVLNLLEVVEQWGDNNLAIEDLNSEEGQEKLRMLEERLKKWEVWASAKNVSKSGLCPDGGERQIDGCDPTVPALKLDFFCHHCPEPKSSLRVTPEL